MKLETGQVWTNSKGTRRTIVESRGFSVGYYSGINEAKTTNVAPWTFIAWVRNTSAKLSGFKSVTQ